jgi:hypothetical protein
MLCGRVVCIVFSLLFQLLLFSGDSQLVQQAMNERQHFLDQMVAMLQAGRILIGIVVSYAPAEGLNPPTWHIK